MRSDYDPWGFRAHQRTLPRHTKIALVEYGPGIERSVKGYDFTYSSQFEYVSRPLDYEPEMHRARERQHRKFVRHLDLATSHQIWRPMVVFRGVWDGDPGWPDRHRPGDEYVKLNYVSTSCLAEAANYAGDCGRILRILLPAGTRAHEIGHSIREIGVNGRLLKNYKPLAPMDIDEVLLMRRTRFRQGETRMRMVPTWINQYDEHTPAVRIKQLTPVTDVYVVGVDT